MECRKEGQGLQIQGFSIRRASTAGVAARKSLVLLATATDAWKARKPMRGELLCGSKSLSAPRRVRCQFCPSSWSYSQC